MPPTPTDTSPELHEARLALLDLKGDGNLPRAPWLTRLCHVSAGGIELTLYDDRSG